MAGRDWLPRGEGDFAYLCGIWLEDLRNAAKLARFGWDAGGTAAVAGKIDAFLASRDRYRANRTPDNRLIKDNDRKEAEGAIRGFAAASIRYNGKMEDEDKGRLGIWPRDRVYTFHSAPALFVQFHVEPAGVGQLVIHFRVLDAEGKARPKGCAGAYVKWLVADKPASSIGELKDDRLATRTPYILTFADTLRGKTVSIALCWQDNKGRRGPWGPMVSTIIP
jgi:hypothetical protein